MGWSGGSILLSSIAESALKNFDDSGSRLAFYGDILDSFEQEDADTLDECFGIDPVLDEALKLKGYVNSDET